MWVRVPPIRQRYVSITNIMTGGPVDTGLTPVHTTYGVLGSLVENWIVTPVKQTDRNRHILHKYEGEV